MTHEEALTVREGDYICSVHDRKPNSRRRVTKYWQNGEKTQVRVRIASYTGQDWISLAMWERYPHGKVWNLKTWTWEDAPDAE